MVENDKRRLECPQKLNFLLPHEFLRELPLSPTESRFTFPKSKEQVGTDNETESKGLTFTTNSILTAQSPLFFKKA